MNRYITPGPPPAGNDAELHAACVIASASVTGAHTHPGEKGWWLFASEAADASRVHFAIVPFSVAQAGLSEWEQRYRRSVISYFVRLGSVPAVDPHPWDNGEAPDSDSIRNHMVLCGINWQESTMVEETSWTIWGGTFGSDTTEFGYQVRVTCKCGKYRGRGFFSGRDSMAELINGIADVEELE